MKNKNGRCWRTKRPRAAGREDRLSKLPNDLLLNILERMDTIDALRTCIITKRLQPLPAMLSHLFISMGSSLRSVLKANPTMARVTKNVLRTRILDITLKTLRIRFVLKLCVARSIAESVAHAMATQRVDAAEFEIITEKTWKNSSDADLLHSGKQFNNFLRACPDAFAALTRLWPSNMRFGEQDIPNILSACVRLESLHLSHCDSGVRSVLQLEHARLVELQIDYGEFERVELTSLPKLQRVTYVFDKWVSSSYEDPMYFGFVPQLSKLSLTRISIISDKTLELSQLLANVPSIDDLHLDFQSEKIWVLPEYRKLLLPVLNKLRYVSLDNLPEGCDLAWTMFIIEGAPSLKELCITVWDHLCIMETDKEYRRENGYCEKSDVKWKSLHSNFKHGNLVKLTIYGFQPDDKFLRYIRRVAEVTVKLAEISLQYRKVCGKDCGALDPDIEVCPSRYPRTDEERKHTIEELGLTSPAMLHFCS